MEIHVAESGRSFRLDCQSTLTIEMLQNALATLIGMPVLDQMLICESGNTRLEPHRSLMSYKLPDYNRHIFLFNRSRFKPDSPCPCPEEFESITTDLPPPPTTSTTASTASHPLDEVPYPALKALSSYDTQFKYEYQKGLAILNASQMRFDACRRLVREQQVQELALKTARGSLDFHYKIIDKFYADFIKQYDHRHKQHSELLENLDMDIERLGRCRLHPGLRSQHRETLLHCVDEGKVRQLAERCSISLKQFDGKVADFKEGYTALQKDVQALFRAAPAVNVRELAQKIEDSARYTEDQANVIQFLGKDVHLVKKLVDKCFGREMTDSLHSGVHDTVYALGRMHDVHCNSHLPRMDACDRDLRKLLQVSQESKNAMSKSVHVHLRSVAALQSGLKDVRNQLAVIKEAMNRQEQIFTELKKTRCTGSAYKACLAEASRRKAGMKLYLGQAGQLAEKLARKREAEVLRRDAFCRAQSAYFSSEILEAMGLYENPSQCVVNCAPFDENLLDVDIADLERYAPKSLVGPLPKISSNTYGGGSLLFISDDEFQGRDTGEDSDAESDSGSNDEIIEISGTSKLEVENAWLKGELASAVAKLCLVDPDTESQEAGDTMQKALHLKDEYAKHLQELLTLGQSKCHTYEKRIRELEQRLTDQHLQMQKSPNTSVRYRLGTLDTRDESAESESTSESSDVTALRTVIVLEPPEEVKSGIAGSSGPPIRPIQQ